MSAKEWLEKKMNNWPAGIHLVMDSVDNGSHFFALGYKYSFQKVLFVSAEGCGSTLPDKPYKVCWTDCCGNVHSCLIPRHEPVSTVIGTQIM